MQDNILCLSAHDELYIINPNKVLYLRADDHYTEVFYTTGAHFLVPFGLVKIEQVIGNHPEACHYLIRMGRKYIVNISRIFRVNTVTELLYLTDDEGNNVSLHVSKPVLRNFIDVVKKNGDDKKA